MFNCNICSYKCVDFSTLFKHINKHNEQDIRHFKICCQIQNCPLKFSSLDSYKKHCIRTHAINPSLLKLRSAISDQYANTSQLRIGADFSSQNLKETSENETFQSRQSSITEALLPPTLPETTASHDEIYGISTNRFNTQKEMDRMENQKYEAGKFLLTFKEKHRVTEECVDEVVAKCNSLLQEMWENIEPILPLDLKHKVYESIDPTINQFSQLASRYHRKMYMKNCYPMVQAKEYYLGSTLRLSGTGFKRHIDKVFHCFYYVSVKETVNALLQHSSFVEYLLASKHTFDVKACFLNFNDGNVYHDHPLFNSDENSLQVILYYDDVQLANTIGTKTVYNKLGFFYISFANLPLHLRSQLNSVYLLCVVKVTDLLKYGYDTVLKPFFDEMHEFCCDGFSLCMPDGLVFRVRGALAFVVGDTLAAHQLLGLKEGVGFANKKCRNCMTEYNQMQEKFTESDFEMRSTEAHAAQCEMLQTDPHASVEYGINRSSQFFNVLHFDPFKSFPHDVMHILLEGCLPYTMKHLLAHYVKRGNFSLRMLNTKLETFPYSGAEVRCKPSNILNSHLKTKGKLHQTASQMWLLARLLPFCVADYVDFDNEKWQCFAVLLRIVSTVLSPCIAKDQISHLQLDINFYLQLFKRSFSEVPVIPKQHYLLHVPSNIENLGPPVGYWAMRFESKHSYFKKIAKNGTYKNLCKFLAERHQHKFTMNLLNGDLYNNNWQEGPCKHVLFSSLSADEQNVLKNLLSISDTSMHLTVCKWVRKGGIHYKRNCFLMCGFANDLPVFGMLENIYLYLGGQYLILRLYKTLYLDENTNAYIVRRKMELKVILSTQLAYLHTFSITRCNQTIYVIMKHDISSICEIWRNLRC